MITFLDENAPIDRLVGAAYRARCGAMLVLAGRAAEASPLLQHAVQRATEWHGDEHLFTLYAHVWLEACLVVKGQRERNDPALKDAVDAIAAGMERGSKPQRGAMGLEERLDTLTAQPQRLIREIAELFELLGDIEQAESWRSRLDAVGSRETSSRPRPSPRGR